MFLIFGAFIAGVITIFAPCVLPLLPVIIGGSVTGDVADKRRPLIIAASLAVSLIAFTLLLKATSLLIDIPPMVVTILSGTIIIIVGILSLFPDVYEKLIIKLGIQSRSQRLMGKGLTNKNSILGPIVTGAALGPVFSSCSPVYAYILATILPGDFGTAIVLIVSFVLGLSIMMLLIGYLGQRFVSRIKWASNPKGWFQRVIAILFIMVGLLVMTGYDKRLQTYVSQNTPFDFDSIAAKLIPSSDRESAEGVLNVKKYEAPEFVGLENWINSQPLNKDDLKGKVVLVDFWTYSCINCIRTQPYLKDWYDRYKDSDFVIVGVHAPEFAFERVPANVQKASRDAGLTYPIALDNNFATWNAYQNQYWPASYLIDTNGDVRRMHAGEGEYAETETAIRQLLRDGGKSVPSERFTEGDANGVPVSEAQTPETYLGTKRASNYVGPTRLIQGKQTFVPADELAVNKWTLGGDWDVSSETITAGNNATLQFRIAAKDAYLVAGPSGNSEIGVKLDGTPISQTASAGRSITDSAFNVNGAQLYRLVSHKSFDGDALLELSVPAGTPLSVFTFGS